MDAVRAAIDKYDLELNQALPWLLEMVQHLYTTCRHQKGYYES
jgi:hypothetical protein